MCKSHRARIEPTINPVDAKNEIWTEVLIPVSSLTGQVKIKIYTHNGSNLFGSVWNDPSRMYVYLSNIVGLKAYDDFAFSDEFLNEEFQKNIVHYMIKKNLFNI